jgi:hypothetical protein
VTVLVLQLGFVLVLLSVLVVAGDSEESSGGLMQEGKGGCVVAFGVMVELSSEDTWEVVFEKLTPAAVREL